MRDYLRINGCTEPLSGSIRVAGAKNAALPLLIASVLTPETCHYRNVPDLEDINVTLRLLQSFGAQTEFSGSVVHSTLPEITGSEAPYSLVKALRASFLVLGPLMARYGSARVALPGGDAIGTRPVDLHLKGLAKFGAYIEMQHGVVVAEASNGLHPASIELDFPSVGATQHLLMTAAGIPGTTTIAGAAREPEIVALADFLSLMGARIDGAGEDTIVVEGSSTLRGAEIAVLGDRIEAATYLAAAAVTGGSVQVTGIAPEAIRTTLGVLEQMGCAIISSDETVSLRAPERLSAVSIETTPFPGLATDVQPILMAALTGARGVSRIRETVFENRFRHAAEFRRFGAQISVQGDVAEIRGVETLSAAPVEGCDIRAAAGMVIMGLSAVGQTHVHQIHHLDRGYEGLVDKLTSIGASISRVPAYDIREVVVGC